MAERDEPLVTLLPRQPGRKEARFGQLLATAEAPSSAQALEEVVARTEQAPQALATVVRRAQAEPPGTADVDLAARVAELADEVASLRREVDELRAALEQSTGG